MMLQILVWCSAVKETKINILNQTNFSMTSGKRLPRNLRFYLLSQIILIKRMYLECAGHSAHTRVQQWCEVNISDSVVRNVAIIV